MQPICEVMNTKLEQAEEKKHRGNLSNVNEWQKHVHSKAVIVTLDDNTSEYSNSKSFLSIH